MRFHVRQSSSEISTKQTQSVFLSSEAGAMTLPLPSLIGLFLTGPLPPPISPGTSSAGSLQSTPLPESEKYVFHIGIFLPTLKKSIIFPSARRKSTGFQCGIFLSALTLTGSLHPFSLRTLVRISTSSAPSFVPANHAATTLPSSSGRTVEAWQESVGLFSNINSFKFSKAYPLP